MSTEAAEAVAKDTASLASSSSSREEQKESDLASWLTIAQQAATLLDPKTLIESYWKKTTRPDGRLFPQTRRTVVQHGVLTRHAAGSALVGLGHTKILAAVSYQVGQPVNASQGDVVVTLQDSRGNSNNNNMDSALQLYLQRLLEETLDLDQLQIVPSKAAFRLTLTVQIINNDGNLRDACLTACTAALADTQLPIDTVWQDGTVFLKDNDVTGSATAAALCSFKMPILPVPLSMGIWHNDASTRNDTITSAVLLVDPAADEEQALKSTITIVVNANEPTEILSLQMSGLVAVTKTELALATKLAAGRAKELRDVLVPSSK